ncbi:MAG TPA: DUF2934 domain-containing protein [Candidatus Acidoferrales bacterium]|jgi:hypothetical protein|nr:DUF2934 domain-containing protein [Candidatus Acidoferrales bacterium]
MPAKKKSAEANPGPTVLTSQPPHHAIALRAYEFFVQRGYNHGWDLQDWLQAESELLGKQPAMPPAKAPRRRKAEAAGVAS